MVTVVIPWCDRAAVGRTLTANRCLLRDHEVVIVNVGGRRELLVELAGGIGLERLKLVHLSGIGFNKSLALNVGIHLAAAETCLMLDADIELVDYDLDAAVALLGEDAFVTLADVVEADRPEPTSVGELACVRNLVELDFRDGPTITVETSSFQRGGAVRSGPGILLARKTWLLQADGYNSAFQGWGWEDIDMIFRLQRAGYRRVASGRGLHVSEREATGSMDFRSEAANRSAAFGFYAAGDFAGSLTRDVRRCFGGAAR